MRILKSYRLWCHEISKREIRLDVAEYSTDELKGTWRNYPCGSIQLQIFLTLKDTEYTLKRVTTYP